jgi:hypothetical protein
LSAWGRCERFFIAGTRKSDEVAEVAMRIRAGGAFLYVPVEQAAVFTMERVIEEIAQQGVTLMTIHFLYYL